MRQTKAAVQKLILIKARDFYLKIKRTVEKKSLKQLKPGIFFAMIKGREYNAPNNLPALQ